MRVLLVTSWNVAEGCGIEEHSRYLIDAVKAADPEIQIMPSSAALDPNAMGDPLPFDLTHLNYHAALHSRWNPETINAFRERQHGKVLVTYHDTGVPNSDQCKTVIAACDAAVVHEPFDDLPSEKTSYWRMGIPAATEPYLFGVGRENFLCFKAYENQPVLGTIGFPFPWKNYDVLTQIAGELGWAMVLIAPRATDEQIAVWRKNCPDLHVRSDFVDRKEAIELLSGCDATGFGYVCHNTGQSAAILQGIAARKPVIALSTCRQFRALYADPIGVRAIQWVSTFESFKDRLRMERIQRVDPGIVALAAQDSWAKLGVKYAALYKSLVA